MLYKSIKKEEGLDASLFIMLEKVGYELHKCIMLNQYERLFKKQKNDVSADNLFNSKSEKKEDNPFRSSVTLPSLDPSRLFNFNPINAEGIVAAVSTRVANGLFGMPYQPSYSENKLYKNVKNDPVANKELFNSLITKHGDEFIRSPDPEDPSCTHDLNKNLMSAVRGRVSPSTGFVGSLINDIFFSHPSNVGDASNFERNSNPCSDCPPDKVRDCPNRQLDKENLYCDRLSTSNQARKLPNEPSVCYFESMEELMKKNNVKILEDNVRPCYMSQKEEELKQLALAHSSKDPNSNDLPNEQNSEPTEAHYLTDQNSMLSPTLSQQELAKSKDKPKMLTIFSENAPYFIIPDMDNENVNVSIPPNQQGASSGSIKIPDGAFSSSNPKSNDQRKFSSPTAFQQALAKSNGKPDMFTIFAENGSKDQRKVSLPATFKQALAKSNGKPDMLTVIADDGSKDQRKVSLPATFQQVMAKSNGKPDMLTIFSEKGPYFTKPHMANEGINVSIPPNLQGTSSDSIKISNSAFSSSNLNSKDQSKVSSPTSFMQLLAKNNEKQPDTMTIFAENGSNDHSKDSSRTSFQLVFTPSNGKPDVSTPFARNGSNDHSKDSSRTSFQQVFTMGSNGKPDVSTPFAQNGSAEDRSLKDQSKVSPPTSFLKALATSNEDVLPIFSQNEPYFTKPRAASEDTNVSIPTNGQGGSSVSINNSYIALASDKKSNDSVTTNLVHKKALPTSTKVNVLPSDANKYPRTSEDISYQQHYVGRTSPVPEARQNSSIPSGYDCDADSSNSTTEDEKRGPGSKKTKKVANKNLDSLNLNRAMLREATEEIKDLLHNLKTEVLTKLPSPNSFALMDNIGKKIAPPSKDTVLQDLGSGASSVPNNDPKASPPPGKDASPLLYNKPEKLLIFSPQAFTISDNANVESPKSSLESYVGSFSSRISDRESIKSYQISNIDSPRSSQDSNSDTSTVMKVRHFPDGVLKVPQHPPTDTRASFDRHVQFASHSPRNTETVMVNQEPDIISYEVSPTLGFQPSEDLNRTSTNNSLTTTPTNLIDYITGIPKIFQHHYKELNKNSMENEAGKAGAPGVKAQEMKQAQSVPLGSNVVSTISPPSQNQIQKNTLPSVDVRGSSLLAPSRDKRISSVGNPFDILISPLASPKNLQQNVDQRISEYTTSSFKPSRFYPGDAQDKPFSRPTITVVDRQAVKPSLLSPYPNIKLSQTLGSHGRSSYKQSPLVSELEPNYYKGKVSRLSHLMPNTPYTLDSRGLSRMTRYSSFTKSKNRFSLLPYQKDVETLLGRRDSEEPSLQHPAGIVLNRCEYFTVPTLDELATMIDEDGRCRVDDFIIGRVGYGTIRFEGKVDLTGMNLDEIVQIRRKEVSVYPDDINKPPVGLGLNRRAEVTLDNSWPVDLASREPITNPLELLDVGWVEDLELVTEKMGAHFLEFRHDTGSWVFLVEHFSEYSLIELFDINKSGCYCI